MVLLKVSFCNNDLKLLKMLNFFNLECEKQKIKIAGFLS